MKLDPLSAALVLSLAAAAALSDMDYAGYAMLTGVMAGISALMIVGCIIIGEGKR